MSAAPLDVPRLEALLQGSRLGLPLHYRSVTESTNDDAARLARAGAPEGTTVVADAQTRGRGRRGRSWSSPPNLNVYLSVVLRPPLTPERAPQVGIVAGLAALQAIRAWLPEAELKWPNDVLVRGRKLCGILAEMDAATDSALNFVIVGIGVNVNALRADFPPELRETATSLRIECGRSIEREEFIAALLSALGQEYSRFLTDGFAPVRQRWESMCGTIGKRVEVDTGSERFSGTVLGLDESGSLLVERADGAVVEIISGDVYLRESASTVR